MRRFATALIALLLLGVRPAPAQTQAGQDQLTLLPGDVVRISVWREGELSGDYQVDERGLIVLPLLGTIKVTEIPVDELRDELIERYRVHLRNPTINITPLRRINVLGEVNRPNLLLVDPTITIGGVVALAGGPTVTGSLDRISIVRQGRAVTQRGDPSASLQSADIRSGDQIIVGERSWFQRNTAFLISLLLSATSIVIQVMR